MEWPSENVRPGGIFQPSKIKYSPETRNFLNVLMEESKLTMLQRNKINYALRSGTSLPKTLNETGRDDSQLSKEIALKDNVAPSSPRRRSLNTILKSGAYERDRYVPKNPIVDRNESIERLQNIMCYGKDAKKKKNKMMMMMKGNEKTLKMKCDNNKRAANAKDVTYDELRKEIEERQHFLNEMESLGEGKKYRPMINQQINALLNDMVKLNVNGTN